MILLKLDRDINGNKIVKYIPGNGAIGFSIQTNQNLPNTHRMTKHDFLEDIVLCEIIEYVKSFGSKRQKTLLGV